MVNGTQKKKKHEHARLNTYILDSAHLVFLFEHVAHGLRLSPAPDLHLCWSLVKSAKLSCPELSQGEPHKCQPPYKGLFWLLTQQSPPSRPQFEFLIRPGAILSLCLVPKLHHSYLPSRFPFELSGD